jgi:futalosine hydrolase
VVLIVCALREELASFAGRPYVTVMQSGIGPVESAIATARALAATRFTLVINAGIAGGFRDHVSVGDSVAVIEEYYVEIGREDGLPLDLPNGAMLDDKVISDPRLLSPYKEGLLGSHLGNGVTSATVTTSNERAALLAKKFNPMIESMEGFSVLRAARRAGVPAIELRGISNIVGDRASNQWDFSAGSTAAVRAVDAFLDNLDLGFA